MAHIVDREGLSRLSIKIGSVRKWLLTKLALKLHTNFALYAEEGGQAGVVPLEVDGHRILVVVV